MVSLSLGSIGSKMKSVNVNRIINLGFSLFGLQIGATAAKQAIMALPSNVGVNVFPISQSSMFKLVDVGTNIASATLLTRFVRNLPFGNYVSPIIGITTAAAVIPQILSVVMSLIQKQTTQTQNYYGGGYAPQSGSAGAPTSGFLAVNQ